MSSKVFSDTVSIGSLTMAERTPAPGSNNVVASGLRTSHSRWLDGHFSSRRHSSRRSRSAERSLASPFGAPPRRRRQEQDLRRPCVHRGHNPGLLAGQAWRQRRRKHANKHDATDAIVDTDTTLLYGDSVTVRGIYDKIPASRHERPRTVTIEGKDLPI